MNKQACIVLAGMLLAAPSVFPQTTWYVSPDGNDANSGASWPQAFLTISNGVYNAQAGDVVLLSNGVYLADGKGIAGSGTAYGTSMVHIDKGITIMGASGNPADVILNGGYSNGAPGAVTNRLVYISHGDALLAAMTITNGFALTNGGGVYLGLGIVSNCVISGNIASNHGGGIFGSSAASTVTHCRVQGNVSSSSGGTYYFGGAICLYGGGNLFASEILDNTNTYRGIGGVALRSRGVIQDCVFSNNSGPYGGALSVQILSGPVLVDDCDFSGHVSATRVIFVYAVAETTPVTITNCRVFNNNLLGLTLSARGVLVTDCLFSNNMGGGIYAQVGDPNTTYGHSNLIVNSDFVGNSTAGYGGGILLAGRGNIVSGCWLNANSAGHGGAIGTYYTHVTNNLITHCTVISNTASGRGGGVALNGATGADTVQYCRILHNSAGDEGGGVSLRGSAGELLRNNLIMSNSANMGGGVYGNLGMATNESCTIAFNYATNRGGGMDLLGFNNTVINCIIVSNAAGILGPDVRLANASESNAFWHSCTPGVTNAGGNNINADPRWVAPDAGDFRLAAGSPCVNTGTNLPWMAEGIDLDGRPRLDRFCRQADMGCYEYIPSGTLIGLR